MSPMDLPICRIDADSTEQVVLETDTASFASPGRKVAA